MSGMEKESLSNDLQLRLETIKKRIGNEPIKSLDAQKDEIIQLLHKLNQIKDSTQLILGALANMEGVTIKDMHLKYDLPID